eukprot:3780089-Rhodomonas_salina.7
MRLHTLTQPHAFLSLDFLLYRRLTHLGWSSRFPTSSASSCLYLTLLSLSVQSSQVQNLLRASGRGIWHLGLFCLKSCSLSTASLLTVPQSQAANLSALPGPPHSIPESSQMLGQSPGLVQSSLALSQPALQLPSQHLCQQGQTDLDSPPQIPSSANNTPGSDRPFSWAAICMKGQSKSEGPLVLAPSLTAWAPAEVAPRWAWSKQCLRLASARNPPSGKALPKFEPWQPKIHTPGCTVPPPEPATLHIPPVRGNSVPRLLLGSPQ